MSATHWIIVEERARIHRAELLLERRRDAQARAVVRGRTGQAELSPLRGVLHTLVAAWGAVAGLAVLVGIQLLEGSMR
jgi:hypothetical protein